MGKLKTQNLAMKSNGILKFDVQKSLLHPYWDPRKWRFRSGQEGVKEGCFAMIATGDGEERRFVVPLAYLDRPSFQRLLERSADEYGFNHDGALMVPCKPSELELMLANKELNSHVGIHVKVLWKVIGSGLVQLRSVCQMKVSFN